MGAMLGQVQRFGKHLSLEQVETYFQSEMAKAEEAWQMTYWRDGKDRPCAARIDGWTEIQVAQLQVGPKNSRRTFYGRSMFQFAPLEWNRIQRSLGKRHFPPGLPTKRGQRRWDQMRIGDSQCMQNWPEIQKSLLRCCVPREIPFAFEIVRRRDLENLAKPTVQWFQVTRIE